MPEQHEDLVSVHFQIDLIYGTELFCLPAAFGCIILFDEVLDFQESVCFFVLSNPRRLRLVTLLIHKSRFEFLVPGNTFLRLKLFFIFSSPALVLERALSEPETTHAAETGRHSLSVFFGDDGFKIHSDQIHEAKTEDEGEEACCCVVISVVAVESVHIYALAVQFEASDHLHRIIHTASRHQTKQHPFPIRSKLR